MKKHLHYFCVAALCLFASNNEIKALYGYVGDCSSFITLNNCTYHVASCSTGSAPGTCVTATTSVPFTGNIGNISSLTMARMGQYTFEDNGDDVMSGTFYYAVHEQGTAPGSFTLLNLPLETGSLPEHREAVPNLDLTSALADDDYTLTIYYTSVVQPDGGGALVPISLDNEGNFYSINFTLITVAPVELVEFSGQKSGDAIALNWETGAELDHSHFEIEKSIDGRTWDFIGSVSGAGDNNLGAQYGYIDERVQAGEQFYRLKSVDLDGGYEYSDIVTVVIEDIASVQIFPNPVKDILTVKQIKDEAIRLELFNSIGQLIQTKSTGSQSFELNLHNLKQGIYFINIYRNNRMVKSERLLKHK